MFSILLGSTALADTAPTAAASAETCPLSVRVYKLDGHGDEAAFALWSDGAAGTATGTILAYAADRRYRIGFANAVAADERDTRVLPTPIVIRFAAPTHVDSAYVETLGGGTCAIHEPYVAPRLSTAVVRHTKTRSKVYPDWSRALQTFRAQAAAAPASAAPAGESVEPPACERPYVYSSTTKAVAVVPPAGQPVPFNGEVAIKVDIAADGTMRAERVEATSHQQAYDRAALASAAESRFAPQIYRCIPVSGDYLFYVLFAAG